MTPRWTRYYECAGSTPRETLLLALERFKEERSDPGEQLAVDLGCGTGRDTLELLRRGWRVLAIDTEPQAIKRLEARVGDRGEAESRLACQVASFEEASIPRADLVTASFSLPFCSPEAFPTLWKRIHDSFRRGGRFCGQLFGNRDGWASGTKETSSEGEITFHTRAEVEALLTGFDIEHLQEVEEDGHTAVGDPKHWHLFHIVARKR